MQQVSDLYPKFALRPHHVWKDVDVQSVTAEIRRGKKEEEHDDRKKPQGKNIMSASATQGGHNGYKIGLNLLTDNIELMHGSVWVSKCRSNVTGGVLASCPDKTHII